MNYCYHYGIGKKINLLVNSFLGKHMCLKKLKYNSYLDIRMNRFLVNKSSYLNNLLKKKLYSDISKKIRTNSYQGFLFKNNLPVRGQRRRTNGRTAKKFFMIKKMYFLKRRSKYKYR